MSLKLREERLIQNSACVLPILKSSVSFFSPVYAPWILHQPVTSFNVKPDYQNSVVDVSPAISSLNDTFSIKLNICCVNPNRDRLAHNSRSKLCSGFTHSHVGRHFSYSFGSVIFATDVVSCVGVVLFSFNLVIFQIVECVFRKSSVASLIPLGMRALHKLLLGERCKLISIEIILSLERSSGWKCPARTTSSLIFNRSNCSFFHPIYWSRESYFTGVLDYRAARRSTSLHSKVKPLEFLRCKIAKVIHGFLKALVLLRIEGLNILFGVFPDQEPVFILILRKVLLAMLMHPARELVSFQSEGATELLNRSRTSKRITAN